MLCLIIKSIIVIIIHLLYSLTIVGLGYMNLYLADISWFFIELALILIIQIPIFLTYKIKSFRQKKHKMIYWIFSVCCTLITAWFWMIYIVGPVWD